MEKQIQQEKQFKSDGGMSEDTKTLIVILCLIFAYPVGVILMLVWMKWKWWIKLLVALPILLVPLALLGIIMVAVLVTINPQAQLEKAKIAAMRNDALELQAALERYYTRFEEYPWGGEEEYSSSNVFVEEWPKKLIESGELKDTFWQKQERGVLYVQKEAGDNEGVFVCYRISGKGEEAINCVPEIIP